jgi:hypothetical protein
MTPPEIQALGIVQDHFTMRWKARGYVAEIGWLEAWGKKPGRSHGGVAGAGRQRVAPQEEEAS